MSDGVFKEGVKTDEVIWGFALSLAWSLIDMGLDFAAAQIEKHEGRVLTWEEVLNRYRVRKAARDKAISSTPG